MTRLINIDETTSQNVADLLTTNSRAMTCMRFFFFKMDPTSFWTQLLELHLVHREDFAITEELNHRRLTWYEMDRN